MDERERAIEKWSSVIGGMGLTGSKADWMSQYAGLHSQNEASVDSSPTSDAVSAFPSALPMAMKVAAKTIGMDLVSVVPLNGNTGDELDRIKAEVEAENRDRKIDSITEDAEYEEMKIDEHPDFKAGPRGKLFYMDYSYGATGSGI